MRRWMLTALMTGTWIAACCIAGGATLEGIHDGQTRSMRFTYREVDPRRMFGPSKP